MKLPVITALGAFALCVAAPALAQPTDAPPPPAGGAGGPPPFPGEGMGGRRERTEELRAALRLRPDQEGAFAAYQAALRPDPAMRDRMRAEREKLAALSPDQRRAERQSSPEWEAMRAHREEATATFLAALTPDQRTAFETFRRDHRPRGGSMGGGMGGGMGGMGGYGPPPGADRAQPPPPPG